MMLDAEPQLVEPGDPESRHRFSLAPDDVVEELAQLARPGDDASRRARHAAYPYRFAVRRLRDAINSACKDLPSVRPRVPTNALYMNPADLAREGIVEGELVRLSSDAGAIEVVAAADPDLRPGVVSCAHGFGALPGEPADPRTHGASTNRLISSTRDRETINAMPRMSGFPVRVVRIP